MKEHWLIIGATSAIARACVRELALQGADLTLVGRDLSDLEASASDARLRGAENARALPCDVGDPGARQILLDQALIDETQLNVLVAVGLMPEQDAMDADPALLARMVDATYTGPMALLQGLAPHFQRQAGGQVVVIGSVAGDRGRRKNYLYGSAKAGLATYAEGLRARLFPCGATVTVVKPGFIDTAMTWGLPGLFLVSSPEDCAKAILKAAKKGQAVLYHPGFWRFIMLIIRHIPPSVMKRLNF
ncbi:MAG TPA: SDR family NAD(P)-dependent oxidoreductase [Hydrogenophaga sp.]|nr:SDR family NAD(P)-dependent oxidoreductase [Hydrogenophaga sp.]